MACDANLTVITKELVTPFHFGRVISSGNFITDIHEKPNFKLEILSGIYSGRLFISKVFGAASKTPLGLLMKTLPHSYFCNSLAKLGLKGKLEKKMASASSSGAKFFPCTDVLS